MNDLPKGKKSNMDRENIKLIQEQVLAKIKRQKDGIRSGINAGDIYIFPTLPDFELIMINHHPDDLNLWYFVPLDMSLIPAGSWDIEISDDEDIGPSIVRGLPIWIHVDDLVLGTKTGFANANLVQEIKQCVSSIVMSKDIPNIWNHDPDYQDHIDTIQKLLINFEEQLKDEKYDR